MRMVARSLARLLAVVLSRRKVGGSMTLASRKNRRPRVCPECPPPTPPVALLVPVSIDATSFDVFFFVSFTPDAVWIGVDGSGGSQGGIEVVNDGNAIGVIGISAINLPDLQIIVDTPLVAGAISVTFPSGYVCVIGASGEFVQAGTFAGVVP